MLENLPGKALIGVTMLAMIAAPAFARNAAALRDLVEVRANSGEAELERRGFTYITGHESRGAAYSYWWHGRDKNCVAVRTANGRYAAITDAPNRDCNQKDGGGNGAAIAGVAVGAILIAAIASSHKSGHHENGQHYADSSQDAQYERGYRDGLHNVAFHNYDRSDAYSRGYEVGIDQRRSNTAYHSGHGGFSQHASLDGMRGRDAVWAIDEMRNRGFENVDSFSSGNTLYGIYYRRESGQCVQMTNADDRVYDIRDIETHPKCR